MAKYERRHQGQATMGDTGGNYFLRYTLAAVAVVLAVVVRLLLDPLLNERLPFITLFAAVAFVAWYGGRWPAILCLLLGLAAVAFFVLEPRQSLGVAHHGDLFGFLFYIAISAGCIALFEQLRSARWRAEQNASEARQQYEQLQRESELRQKAEATVAEEGERLRVTLTSIGDGVITTDDKGRVAFLNDVAQQLTGWSQQEAQGVPLEQVFVIVNETTRQPVENPALRSLREGKIVGLANHTLLISKDGTERPIDDSAAPIRDQQGDIFGSVLVFRDITERKQAEAALSERVRLLSLNAAVGKALVQGNCLGAMLRKCAEALVEHLDGAFARVWTLNAAEGVLELQASAGMYTHLDGPHSRVPVGKYKIGLIAEERKPHLTNVVVGDSRVSDQQWAKREGMVAFAGYPLVVDDRLVGVMAMFARQPLSETTLEAMASVADEIAVGIEAKRGDSEVREQERRTRTILESISDAFFGLDRDWRFTYVNRQAESLLGRSRDELIGKSIWDEYADTLGTEIESNYRRAMAGESAITFEIFYSPHDRWYEVRAYPTSEGLSVYFRDVGERKRAEIALRESEEKLRLLADTVPQLAWMARPDGHIFWYNRRWYEYSGTTPEEMEGWGWQSVHDPAQLPSVLERWKASIATGQPFEMVFPLRGADGQFRSFLTRVNPFRDEQQRVVYWFGTNTDIEEQKRAQEALAESERRFRQLADAMPQIVWTARPDGQIEYMNRRWHELTCLPVEVGNAGWDDILHPDEAGSAGERWAASVQSGETFEMELRLLDRRSHTYRWHLIRTVAAGDEQGEVVRWYGTATDVHEQKQAEESSIFLAEASAALASVVDYESTLQKVANLAVPYFADWSAVDMANDDGSLRRLAVSHQDAEKIALAHQLMRDYPPDPQSPSGALAVLRSGKPQLIGEIPDEMLAQAAKDERHLALIRSLGLKSYICVPLVVSGDTLGVLTFATAESGRRYTEADLTLAMDLASRAAVAVENTQLYQALRESDRRKDEFLATLAHELRNPLAPIRNALQILGMPRVDAEMARHSRELMERQVHHLVRLVDDLLDVSRVMRGKIELRKERIELATVVARAVETAQPLVDAQGHQLSVNLRPDSLLLDADPVRLAQVVGNLLTNAAKYTEPNGRIWLTAELVGGTAVLTIRDTGIGIAPDTLPHVFQLFVQADHASTKAQGGLGIGLTLVKNLVEMHRGTVEAHSEGLGKGSEFIVRLPISPPQLQEERCEPGQTVDPVAGSGRRLLVVDDNQDAALSLAMLLRLQGHEVRVAHSGAAALEMTKTFSADLIFLDIGMPGMDGYEVARRIRQQPGLENVVLAALTGWGQQEDRRRTAEAGFNHHLVKPPEPKALEHVLADLRQTGSQNHTAVRTTGRQ